VFSQFSPGQAAVLVARNDRLTAGESLGGIANGLVDGRFVERLVRSADMVLRTEDSEHQDPDFL